MKDMRNISGFQALALVMCLAPSACMDSRNATTPGQLYHCTTDTDCLSGWACHCGYCQQPGIEQYGCSATGNDTSEDGTIVADTSGDTGGPPVGTSLGICNQEVSTDVIFTTCNLASWSGCDSGYGCYYGPAIKQTLCKPHSSFAEGAACDPCNLTECGLTAAGEPLICDAVDKICRPTCDATVPVKSGQCPTAQQCYQLVDDQNVPYPSTGGICAP